MENGSKGPLTVYTIVERAKDKKGFWVRIGVAFRNHDGSLNVRLDAVPVNGTMHIRESKYADREAPLPSDADLEIVDALAH